MAKKTKGRHILHLYGQKQQLLGTNLVLTRHQQEGFQMAFTLILELSHHNTSVRDLGQAAVAGLKLERFSNWPHVHGYEFSGLVF